MPRFDKKNHYAVLNSDFLTEYGHFLDGLGCQAFLDALAAKRIDALLNLPAQIHADLGCQTDVALYLSEGEGAVGMLFQRFACITWHMAVLAIVVLAAAWECLFLIGLKHLLSLWAHDDLLERRMMHIAKSDGNIAASSDYSVGRNGYYAIGSTREPLLAAKLIAVGFPISWHMTLPKRIHQNDAQGFRACLQMLDHRHIAVGTRMQCT